LPSHQFNPDSRLLSSAPPISQKGLRLPWICLESRSHFLTRTSPPTGSFSLFRPPSIRWILSFPAHIAALFPLLQVPPGNNPPACWLHSFPRSIITSRASRLSPAPLVARGIPFPCHPLRRFPHNFPTPPPPTSPQCNIPVRRHKGHWRTPLILHLSPMPLSHLTPLFLRDRDNRPLPTIIGDTKPLLSP